MMESFKKRRVIHFSRVNAIVGFSTEFKKKRKENKNKNKQINKLVTADINYTGG